MGGIVVPEHELVYVARELLHHSCAGDARSRAPSALSIASSWKMHTDMQTPDLETLIVSENLCRLAASVCLKGPHARSSPDQPRAARLQQGGLGPPCVSNSAPTGSFSTSTETVRLCAVACTCRRSLACAARVVTPESGAKNVLHKDGGGRAAAGSCRARAAAAAGARREPAGTGAWRASGRSPAAGRQSPAAAGAAAPCGSLAARLVPQHCPAWV